MPLAKHDTIALDAIIRTECALPLHGLAALRILIVLCIGLGYASTMSIGPGTPELGRTWGYDPSLYGIQLLFIFSGFLAVRSMTQGRSWLNFFRSRLLSFWPALIAATLFSVGVIYPFLCAPDAVVRMSIADLSKYVLETVFLINPGAKMPGLMDDAKYTCLLQGAIWTLRWGVVLHMGFLLGWATRLLRHRGLTLLICLAAITLHITITDVTILKPDFTQKIEPILPGIRLGYAYLIGISLFQWQDKLRLTLFRALVGFLITTYVACGFYIMMPWSSLLEILGVLTWLSLGLSFLTAAPMALRHCPRLAPILYVCIWPAAQVIVLFNPDISQFMAIIQSTLLAVLCTGGLFFLRRQTTIQPAGL